MVQTLKLNGPYIFDSKKQTKIAKKFGRTNEMKPAQQFGFKRFFVQSTNKKVAFIQKPKSTRKTIK